MAYKGNIDPSEDIRYKLILLEERGHKWNIMSVPEVDPKSKDMLFVVFIEVHGFGKFKGRSLNSEEAAFSDAKALFTREYNQQFNSFPSLTYKDSELMVSKQEPTSSTRDFIFKMGYRDKIAFETDVKWIEALNTFNQIASSEKSRSVVIEKLAEKKLLNMECRLKEEDFNDDMKGDNSRFECFTQNKRLEPTQEFETTVFIGSVTITKRHAEMIKSKKKAYTLAYFYFFGLAGILERVKKATYCWSPEETKRKLCKFITEDKTKITDYKIIQEFSGPIKVNGTVVHQSVNVEFLKSNFKNIHPTDIKEAAKASYKELFEYLKRLAHFYEVSDVKNFSLSNSEKSLKDSSIKAPCLLPEMQHLKPSDLELPIKAGMDVAKSRLTCLINVVNNFLAVYYENAEATAIEIVDEFIAVEEFTKIFGVVEHNVITYTLVHETLGNFEGAGSTLVKAMEMARLKVFDLMHQIVFLVLSYRVVEHANLESKNSKSFHVIWLNDLINYNSELVKMKFKEMGPNLCEGKLTIEVLFFSVTTIKNTPSDCKLMLYSGAAIILKSFASKLRIPETDVNFLEYFKKKLPANNWREISRIPIPVPVEENAEQASSRVKLMELIVRFQQIYKAHKSSNCKQTIILELLKKLNRKLFNRKNTFDNHREFMKTRYTSVLVISPLGSFTGNGFSRAEATNMAYNAAFNRLHVLKRIVHKLCKLGDLNSVTQEDITRIHEQFSKHLVFKINTYECKFILQLSHFFSCEGISPNRPSEARMAAFREMVQSIYQLRKQAQIAIFREDNEALALKKKESARAEAEAEANRSI